MGGREVGGPGKHACRPYGHRKITPPGQGYGASGARPAGREQGPASRRSYVPRRRRRAHQGAVIMADQPGRLDAPTADAVEGGDQSLSFVVVSDIMRDTDTARTPTCSCPRSAGARRTVRSPIPSAAISRQRAFLAAPGEARPGLVATRRSRQAHGLRRGLRPCFTSRISPSMPRLSGFETTDAATSTSAPTPRSKALPMTA